MTRTLILALVVVAAARTDARADERGIDLHDLPLLADIVVDENARSKIAVVAATHASEDIVVGAAKREQSLGDAASAVTVITGDRLRRFGYRTISEALRGAAGLFVVDDRMSQRLGIRGLQILGDYNTRILLLVDGATVNEPWNQFAGIGLDVPVAIDDVERIEIVRGPVSTLYGTNAFFGIINIVTRSAERAPGVYGRVLAGSFGTTAAVAGFATGDVDRQLRGSVYASHRAGETIDIENVGRTSADGETAFNASLVGRWDRAYFQVRGYRKLRELAGAPYDTRPGDTDTNNVDEMVMGEAGSSREIGPVTLSARAYAGRYRFDDALNYAAEPSSVDIGDSTWIGGEVRGHVPILGEALAADAGAEVTWNQVKSRSFAVDGSFNVDVPTALENAGFYAELVSAPTSFVTLTGGARWDISSLFASNVSPRAALLLHDGDTLGLKLLYAQGFRNPSPYEAFFDDGRSFIANPSLRPERITSYEAVLWARPVLGLSLRLSGFFWDCEDLIELQDVEGGLVQSQNITTMTSTGIEAEVGYRDARGFSAFAGGTVASVARNGSTGDAQNAPMLVAQGGVSSPKLFDLLHLSTELELVSGRHTRDPMTDADTFVAWNATLYVPRWKGMDATIGVRNILGKREQVPAQNVFDRADGTMPVYQLPGEGREVYVQVGFSR